MFIWLHTAAKIPHITKPKATSQEQPAMVLLCLHTAAKIPINQNQEIITGTERGVSLSAYSSKNTTYNQTQSNITGTTGYGVGLDAYRSNDAN